MTVIWVAGQMPQNLLTCHCQCTTFNWTCQLYLMSLSLCIYVFPFLYPCFFHLPVCQHKTWRLGGLGQPLPNSVRQEFYFLFRVCSAPVCLHCGIPATSQVEAKINCMLHWMLKCNEGIEGVDWEKDRPSVLLLFNTIIHLEEKKKKKSRPCIMTEGHFLMFEESFSWTSFMTFRVEYCLMRQHPKNVVFPVMQRHLCCSLIHTKTVFALLLTPVY